MQIVVIGIGYVGLVTATCLAEMGQSVICLDIDKDKIARLQKGEIPIYEPGLKEMVLRNTRDHRLTFTSNYPFAIQHATVCFIAVDTPSLPNGEADLTAVRAVSRSIAEHMNDYLVVVNKSTVPVGTCQQVETWIQEVLDEKKKTIPFDVVSNPEFLKEGDAIADFMKPDRVIIGSTSERAIDIMKEVYDPFMWSRERLLVMDPLSAELTKYASNGMLATRISFMDELAHFCETMGADIHQVRLGMGADSRIGYNFLWAGVGYGGSCLPKDVRALVAQAANRQCPLHILQEVDRANSRQPEKFLEKIFAYFNGSVAGKTIGVLGLSFKPETDDMRCAPSLTILQKLAEEGALLRVYDPAAMDNTKKHFPPSPRFHYCRNEEEAALDADALLLLTEWKPFRRLPLTRILENMRGRAFFDGRNQYQPEKMRRHGFDYFCIGRPSVVQDKEVAQVEEREAKLEESPLA